MKMVTYRAIIRVLEEHGIDIPAGNDRQRIAVADHVVCSHEYAPAVTGPLTALMRHL